MHSPFYLFYISLQRTAYARIARLCCPYGLYNDIFIILNYFVKNKNKKA